MTIARNLPITWTAADEREYREARRRLHSGPCECGLCRRALPMERPKPGAMDPPEGPVTPAPSSKQPRYRPNTPGAGRPRVVTLTAEEITARRKAGETYKQIAIAEHIGHNTVSKIVFRAGLAKRYAHQVQAAKAIGGIPKVPEELNDGKTYE